MTGRHVALPSAARRIGRLGGMRTRTGTGPAESRSQRLASGVLVLGLLLGLVARALTAAPVLAASPDLVISQVYGGGGTSGATRFCTDAIELDHRGSVPAPLAGKSVHYGSATG